MNATFQQIVNDLTSKGYVMKPDVKGVYVQHSAKLGVYNLYRNEAGDEALVGDNAVTYRQVGKRSKTVKF